MAAAQVEGLQARCLLQGSTEGGRVQRGAAAQRQAHMALVDELCQDAAAMRGGGS